MNYIWIYFEDYNMTCISNIQMMTLKDLNFSSEASID